MERGGGSGEGVCGDFFQYLVILTSFGNYSRQIG